MATWAKNTIDAPIPSRDSRSSAAVFWDSMAVKVHIYSRALCIYRRFRSFRPKDRRFVWRSKCTFIPAPYLSVISEFPPKDSNRRFDGSRAEQIKMIHFAGKSMIPAPDRQVLATSALNTQKSPALLLWLRPKLLSKISRNKPEWQLV
jgi:hypothetical protein